MQEDGCCVVLVLLKDVATGNCWSKSQKNCSDELKQLAKAEVGDSMCEDLLMCKQM